MIRRRLLPASSVLLALAATVMVFAQDRVFDADDFATTLGSTLRDPAVNEYLAAEVSGELVKQAPDLAISGPLLAGVTGSVLESDVALGIVELSAREGHAVLFEAGSGSFVLELSDLVVSVQLALRAISPELAESVPEEIESLTVGLSTGELTASTVRVAERARVLTFVLTAMAAASLLLLVALEPSLFRGLARLGFVLGFVGLVLIVAIAVGGTVLASYGRDTLEEAALSAAWRVVLGDLVMWGWVLVVVGALLASLGWAAANVGNVVGTAHQLVERALAEPVTKEAGVVRSIGILLVAVWALISPQSLPSRCRAARWIRSCRLRARPIPRSLWSGRTTEPGRDEGCRRRPSGAAAFVGIPVWADRSGVGRSRGRCNGPAGQR